MQKTELGPSFTRGEYWLLESVVEVPIAICCLDSAALEDFLNKQGHGLMRRALSQTLNNLFQAKLIEAVYVHGSSYNGAGEPQQLTPKQVEEALNEDMDPTHGWYNYRLTEAGGQAWETFAQPAWERFLEVSCYSFAHPDKMWTGSICGTNKHLVEYFLNGLGYTKRSVEPHSLAWKESQPWQATYWKVLPIGYEVSFQYRHLEDSWDWDEVPYHYAKIYDRAWYRWR